MNQIDITGVRTSDDIGLLDTSSITEQKLPNSLYRAIKESAQYCPNQIAIKYILDGDVISQDKIPFAKKVLHKAIKLLKGQEYAAPYREVTYSQLANKVTQTANALRKLGINRKDVTSIIMPNFPETYYTLWGASTAGIANPINPLLDASIIKEIMLSSNTKVLIALGPLPGSDIWQKVLAIKDEIPNLKAVISVFGKSIPADKQNKVPVLSFSDLLKQEQAEELEFEEPNQRDICAYFHTGGTTGLPKLAQHTHLNQLTNAGQVNLISPVSPGDTIFVGLPIFHVNAAVATGIGPIMNTSTILLAGPAGYRGKNVMANLLTLIKNYKVSLIMAVPTVYAGILTELEKRNEENFSLPDLKLAISGAAPLSSELQNKFIRETGINLIEGYGSTESSSVCSLMPVRSINEEASVGLIIPGMKVATVEIGSDDQLIKQCGVGEVGEIVIAGNNVFPGYLDEAHNKNLWVTLEDNISYVRTGDLGRFDKHGYLSLAGRKKELIIRGGHNIDPKMIEDTAMKHPEVQLAAAVPRPDTYSGELPVLYVTKTPNSTITSEELMVFMQKQTPERAATPKLVNIIEEMPLTAVGKIYKPELVCAQITSVVTQEVAKILDKEDFKVLVTIDKKLGIKTIIELSDEKQEETERQVKQQLVGYAFKYQLHFMSTTTQAV
ncbi:AMP-binding protein [Psychrosphaera aestuarii]|uniref:AMP-binding protein n=1 Tax=Psychrosphaera aestuarii TaxID=1266052 RepID=UPI001FD5D95F|nr:AMP-binding protein [Psychrosphaera aestuarii]